MLFILKINVLIFYCIVILLLLHSKLARMSARVWLDLPIKIYYNRNLTKAYSPPSLSVKRRCKFFIPVVTAIKPLVLFIKGCTVSQRIDCLLLHHGVWLSVSLYHLKNEAAVPIAESTMINMGKFFSFRFMLTE